MIQFSLYRSPIFRRTDRTPSLLKTLNFDSSEKMTLFQSFEVQCRCSLAYFSRVFFIFGVKSGFFAERRKMYPCSMSLLCRVVVEIWLPVVEANFSLISDNDWKLSDLKILVIWRSSRTLVDRLLPLPFLRSNEPLSRYFRDKIIIDLWEKSTFRDISLCDLPSSDKATIFAFVATDIYFSLGTFIRWKMKQKRTKVSHMCSQWN